MSLCNKLLLLFHSGISCSVCRGIVRYFTCSPQLPARCWRLPQIHDASNATCTGIYVCLNIPDQDALMIQPSSALHALFHAQAFHLAKMAGLRTTSARSRRRTSLSRCLVGALVDHLVTLMPIQACAHSPPGEALGHMMVAGRVKDLKGCLVGSRAHEGETKVNLQSRSGSGVCERAWHRMLVGSLLCFCMQWPGEIL